MSFFFKILVIAPSQAWERRRRCNDYTLETFHRDPVGNQSHPVKPSQQPEASLASWCGQPIGRSVDSQCQGRAIEPREYYPPEPPFLTARGQHRHSARARGARSSRGRRTGHRHTRVPQELGTPWSSPREEVRPGIPDTNPRPAAVRSGLPGAKRQTQRVVSPSEAQRSAATGRQGIGAPHRYRGSRRTQPAGIRWREGGAGSRNRWRETWPVHRNRIPCSRNNSG
jgi:hypothetical protein